MTTYLSMNGTSDYIQLPSMTMKKFVFDAVFPTQATKMLLDARVGQTNGYVYAMSDGTLATAGASFQVTGYVRDTRATVTFNAINNIDANGNFTDNVTIFANNTGGENFRGTIYSIKCYNANNVLIANYDMSTGTVQDQTGNGNHATLTGGTWLNDASGSIIDAGTVSITGDTTLTPNGNVILNGNTTLTGDSSLSAIGSLLINGISTLDANGTINIDGSLILNADNSLSGNGSLTADGDILGVSVTANFDAISSLIADGSILVKGDSTLSADTILNAIPLLIVSGLSSLSASGGLIADGTAFDPTKQIISKTNLQGERKITTLLSTQQDLTVRLNGEVILTIRLVGDIK
jgi:hypothetical protein